MLFFDAAKARQPMRLIFARENDAMARIVRHEENGPYEVPEGTELPVWICGCGLSKNKPFCDGSHKKTRDEGADVYVYDENDHRTLTK
jgi:CDGSH-type Zn-finger protein